VEEVPVKNIVWIPILAAGLLVTTLGCREDTESPTAPEPTPALATTATTALAFYQVSGGGRHTCGLTTDNRAYCWGFNGAGQLGDGTHTRRLRPVAVAGGLRFRQVSAGSYHTCGVTTAYRAYCWGLGADGSLGDGTTTDHLTPVLVAGGHLFRLVDAGDAHSCGVTYPDNRAYCWGVNDRGALGDGTGTRRAAPVAVKGGLLFHEVSAGLTHTCGVTTSDRAYCWGSDSVGQLGNTLDAPYSVTPSPVAGDRRFKQIAAGAGFTCAVTTGERAFCWGSGRKGQIGDGTTKLRFTPRAVAGGLYFDRVTTGESHTCGETTTNRAYCWGTAGIGDGTTTTRLTPVAVAGGRFYSQVSAGDNHTCGRTAANVAYCWGWNDYGQLGDGTTTLRLKPVPVAGP
jgi:alpha-tubulin suppressor-like RCC1 family protein